MKLRVKVDDQLFDVEVGDLSVRPIIAVVDGESFQVTPEDPAQEDREAEALSKPAPCVPEAQAAVNGIDKSKVVAAPIPGVIIAISVNVGAQVEAGTELCVLEAMKMKNSIRATRTGTIGAVHITVGDHVRHNQILMEFCD